MYSFTRATYSNEDREGGKKKKKNDKKKNKNKNKDKEKKKKNEHHHRSLGEAPGGEEGEWDLRGRLSLRLYQVLRHSVAATARVQGPELQLFSLRAPWISSRV